jgi:ABC-type uncharacterized transport system involved in gliding motility auxiliary subunit
MIANRFKSFIKFDRKQIATLGLYMTGIAALVALGFYIVQREWNLPLQICLGLVVIGIALFAVLDPQRVREILTGRQARYGSNSLVMTLAFVGILVVINYLFYQNPQRWDLTENQQFTLAPETLDTLKSLPQTVKAMAFFTPRTSSDQAQGLLDQYKFHSNGKFDYEFINPDSNPALAHQYNVTRDGTIVLQMGDHQEPVSLVSEEEITSALVKLLNPGTRLVYFLTGHGEYDTGTSGDQGYSQAKAALQLKNYTVKPLNLLAENKIPDDASVIVIAGPQLPLSADEVSKIKDFVAAGHGLIVMEEPIPMTKFANADDPLADYLAQTWNIVLGKDVVVDLTSNQPLFAVANQYGSHLITQKMNSVATYFPTARSVTVGNNSTSNTPTKLVLTANQSWAETDLAPFTTSQSLNELLQSIKPDPNSDIMGPVSLAVAAEDTTSHARVVVFGDSDFASDTYFNQLGNGDLFVNSIDWATQQENQINLTPKANTTRMMVPPGRYTMNLILFGSVFVMPGLVLISGIVVWVQRRRRG